MGHIRFDDLKKMADDMPKTSECKKQFLKDLCTEFGLDMGHLGDSIILLPKKYFNGVDDMPDWFILTEFTDDIILCNKNTEIQKSLSNYLI